MSTCKNNAVTSEEFEKMINRIKNIKLQKSDEIKIKDILQKGCKWRKTTKFLKIEHLKDKTQEELWKDLYILRYKFMCPMGNIAYYFDLSRVQLYRKMKKIGWEYAKEESLKLAAQLRDYEKLLIKGRKTILKKQSFGLGSNLEDYVRQYINLNLTDLLKEYEIIVGINNLSIIKGKEIDIPIIIMNGKNIYKFAIEIGAERHHKERELKDDNKTICLNYKSYICFILNNFKSNFTKNELHKKLDEVVEKICDFVKQ